MRAVRRAQSGAYNPSMRGRQISFYMLPSDEVRFVGYLVDRWGVSFVASIADSPEVKLLDSAGAIRHKGSLEILLKSQWIEGVKRSAIEIKDWDSERFVVLPTGTYHFVLEGTSTLKVPFVEFSRSGLNSDGDINRGRLYLPLEDLRDQIGSDDIALLESFQNSTWRWIRKNGVRMDGHFGWMLPDAAAAVASGGIGYVR